MCNPLIVCMSYSTIDNVLTNLLPAGLQDFLVLDVSKATETVNKLFVLPRSNSPLVRLFGGQFSDYTNSGT